MLLVVCFVKGNTVDWLWVLYAFLPSASSYVFGFFFLFLYFYFCSYWYDLCRNLLMCISRKGSIFLMRCLLVVQHNEFEQCNSRCWFILSANIWVVKGKFYVIFQRLRWRPSVKLDLCSSCLLVWWFGLLLDSKFLEDTLKVSRLAEVNPRQLSAVLSKKHNSMLSDSKVLV